MSTLWKRCLEHLERDLPTQQFNTWIRPLHVTQNDQALILFAPNRYVLDRVQEQFRDQIQGLVDKLEGGLRVTLDIGGESASPRGAALHRTQRNRSGGPARQAPGGLNPDLTFQTFIEGKSNRLARAAALVVADHCGGPYNPLLIYGGVGLGKTHLLHALSNAVLKDDPNRKVAFVSAERFVGEMVSALRNNAMDKFKNFYRTSDLLLVDDVQFIAGKDQSQEEFFHVFNSMVEAKKQIVMTCDRYPRNVTGLEDRLKSRFGWGLSVAVEPPDLETRVAIVLSKAEQAGVQLPEDIGFFIASRIHSNVRELEGALRSVLAYANFTQGAITIELAREALKDILRSQEQLVSIDTIQKTVAEYYRLRISDLTSKSRKRSVVRPRQVAMTLAKELTSASLPEIGLSFGGRDHTTVLHACSKIHELRESNAGITEDYKNLLRGLST